LVGSGPGFKPLGNWNAGNGGGGGLPLGYETGCFTNDTFLKGGGLGERLRVSSTHSQIFENDFSREGRGGSYVAVSIEGCPLVGEGFFVAGFVSWGW
jgi:hypothetical protein